MNLDVNVEFEVGSRNRNRVSHSQKWGIVYVLKFG